MHSNGKWGAANSESLALTRAQTLTNTNLAHRLTYRKLQQDCVNSPWTHARHPPIVLLNASPLPTGHRGGVSDPSARPKSGLSLSRYTKNSPMTKKTKPSTAPPANPWRHARGLLAMIILAHSSVFSPPKSRSTKVKYAYRSVRRSKNYRFPCLDYREIQI